MLVLLIRRAAIGFATLFVIATLSFFLTRTVKGSPFSSERSVHPEILQRFNEYYGLDRPMFEQYVRAMKGYLRGDLGPSMYYRDQTCNDIVWAGMGRSVILGALASAVALLVGIPLGVLAAARQNKFSDHAAMTVSTTGICIPNFLLGPLLILLFAFTIPRLLHLPFDHPLRLPAGQWPEDWTSWLELRKLVLPVLTLSLVHIAYLSRLTRAGMLDVLTKDYIRTARAKGLSPAAVVLKHALKNGVTPALSYAGPMMAVVITGSLVVESVFAIGGLGQHFVKSALNRDLSLILACTLVYSVLIIAANLVVDFVYGLLDPRVRSTA